MWSFAKIKPSRNGENSLSFTDVGKSCQSREFCTWQICPDAIRESKIFAKISEFTVSSGTAGVKFVIGLHLRPHLLCFTFLSCLWSVSALVKTTL